MQIVLKRKASLNLSAADNLAFVKISEQLLNLS